jgi:glc operon protein GlcG
MNSRRVAGAIIALALAASVTTANLGAQNATLAQVTLQGDAAKRAMTKTQLNMATARAIVDACLEFARTTNGSYAIFVLAPNGDILQAAVMDGQLPIGIETAQLKAKTALYARSSSSAVAQRFNTVDGRLIRTDLGRESGLAYYFVGGGLPIVVEDQIIGAIGVGGGNQDEQCAHTALTKVLGPQPPLTPPPAPGGGAPGGRGGAPGGAPAGRGGAPQQ